MTPIPFALTVDLSAASIRIEPGGQAVVTVEIRNVGQVVQHYEALLVGLPAAEMWSRDIEVIKLRPGENGTIALTVRVPENGPLRGGSHLVGVVVRSPYQPEVSRAEELTIEVAAVTGVELTVQPTVVEARTGGRVTATVANRGNIPLQITMVAGDDQARARFDVRPTDLNLPPGRHGEVVVAWDVAGFFTGQPRRSAITIQARTGTEVRATEKVAFVQPPRIAAAVLTALGVVLAVALVAGAIIVGAVITRPTAQPSTEAPASTVAPTGLETSGSGAAPPVAPTLALSPAMPRIGKPITVTATTTEDITAWAWQVSDAGNNLVSTADTPSTFHWTPQTVGTFTLRLTITSAGGQTTATLPVEVAPPAVETVGKEVAVGATTVTTDQVNCPTGRVPISGGVAVDPVATTVVITHLAPATDGWTVTLTNLGPPSTVQLTAVCAEPLPGMTVQRSEKVFPNAGVERLQATCPNGQVVLGGGGGIRPDGVAGGTVHQSWPDRDEVDTPWRYWRQIIEANGPATAEVWAICAPPPKDYEVTIADQTEQGNQTIDLTLSCSKGQLLAAGVALDPHATAPDGSLAWVRSTAPVTGQPGAPPMTWALRVMLRLPTEFRLNGYAVCADLGG